MSKYETPNPPHQRECLHPPHLIGYQPVGQAWRAQLQLRNTRATPKMTCFGPGGCSRVSRAATLGVFEHNLCHRDLPFWHLVALAAGFVAILLSFPENHGEDANLPHRG